MVSRCIPYPLFSDKPRWVLIVVANPKLLKHRPRLGSICQRSQSKTPIARVFIIYICMYIYIDSDQKPSNITGKVPPCIHPRFLKYNHYYAGLARSYHRQSSRCDFSMANSNDQNASQIAPLFSNARDPLSLRIFQVEASCANDFPVTFKDTRG